MDYKLPIPSNWQDFESICHRLWIEIWNDPNAQKNGRQGQSQHGIDIFGIPIYSKLFSGVQCKDKDSMLGSKLTQKEFLNECKKAKKFTPKISSFTIATTSVRDEKLQSLARQLSLNKSYPFTTQVWSWNDIQSEIIYRPSILKHYYPNIVIPTHNFISINLNRFSSKDQYYAFFSRPITKNILSKKLKDSLISISYELSDNAYVHGKASQFNITIEDRKIIFKDNGKKFNPLKDLDASKISTVSNVGSFVLDLFLREFKNFVKPRYIRKSHKGITENILELKLSKNLPVNKNDLLELFVDWKDAAGRDSARHLANSIQIEKDIKEIVWSVNDTYALSFFVEFVRVILQRINSKQKFIVFVPRNETYKNFGTWFNDKSLIIIYR